MSATPNSNPSSYLSVANFLLLRDWRTVADFVSDAAARTYTSAGAMTADPVLALILNRASGEVESACAAGHRYEPADLAVLTGVSQAKLFGIVADLAMGYVLDRRPNDKRGDGFIPAFKRALEDLEKLRSGERVFGFVESQDAGVSEDYVETPRDVVSRNMTTLQAGRYFGRRANRQTRE